MKRRLVERELLDLQSGATESEIEGNLLDIASANRWLGGTSLVLWHLGRLVCAHPERPLRFLDMATGGGDIPIAIAEWARRVGVELEITAVDRNAAVLKAARRNTARYPEIRIEEQDIMDLPYKGRSFDFVVLSQALHHFDNEQAAAILRGANRVCAQAMVVSDFRRSALLAGVASLGLRFVSNRLSRHDGRISLLNGFTPGEMRELAEAADIPQCSVYSHGAFRLALVVDKRTAICDTISSVVTAHHLPMAA